MSPAQPDFSDLCSFRDLGMAYRKAKVDLFYSSRIRRRELLTFETNLEQNLKRLRAQLLGGNAPIIPPDSWTVVPKSMHVSPTNGFVDSDASNQWKLIRNQEPRPTAEFRLMEAMPIDFHVFATLWIHKVGYKFEARLSEDVRGNRLRRNNRGELNSLSLGSNPPYIHPYRKWRDDGMRAIRNALDDNRAVVAITADASSFYHKLDPIFMLDEAFIELVGVELDNQERALHKAFIGALRDWAKATPLGRGLPVGLVASSVIANLALFELDSTIRSEVAPIYYARYVDDIILVIDDVAGLRSSDAVWEWLCERTGGLLVKQGASSGARESGSSYQFCPAYLKASEVEFANGKNKTFLLSGPSGKSLLTSIERQIQARASEWNALPELPSEGTEIESNLLSAMQATGEFADSLRKADNVSVQRAAFALNLRDIEAYSRALRPEAWAARRHSFLDALIRHVLVLPALFQFFGYVPRMIDLAGVCGDVEYLRKIIESLEGVLRDLGKCGLAINGMGEGGTSPTDSEILNKFRDEISRMVTQCVESSFREPESSDHRKAWSAHFGESLDLFPQPDLIRLRRIHRGYIRRDLAYRPLKQMLLPAEISLGSPSKISKKSLAQFPADSAAALVDEAVLECVVTLSKVSKIPHDPKVPSGLLFPTRPPSAYEIYILHPKAFTPKGAKEITACLLGLRGFKPERPLPAFEDAKRPGPLAIPFGDGQRPEIRIAVASWKTCVGSWNAAVTRNPDPDGTRLDRLYRLLDAVISCREKPHYLILPECSLPLNWFVGAALKLRHAGVSLIGGVEYLHAKRGIVRNQVWAALTHDALGFSTMLHYVQDKQHPAQHEEAELKRLGGRVLKPQVPWTVPPILDHGGFHFALLVCSELTNIRYRADVRGNVDALFVPEWNPDTETFNALVESAALDVHAYIIQCNDRQYGDSRIRVPHKDAWKRDVIRVKGGIEDYFVVGEIDVLALRQFQSNFRSPPQPFKPVPDGFEISHQRKVLPV